MYTQSKRSTTNIKSNTSYEGETIERRIQKMMVTKEPITDSAPLIYTERKDGVKPEYDIRTDRWEIALEAMDKVAESHTTKREMNIGDKAFEGMNEEEKTEHIKKYPYSKHKNWKPETGDSTSDK